MIIKRENWRGKYVVVVRDRGRIKSWIKYSSKISLKRYISHYKVNNSLNLNMKRVKLYNYYEITLFKPESFKYKYPFQVLLSAKFRNRIYYARSDKYYSRNDYKTAKNEAEERLFKILSEELGFGYDERKGKKIVAEKNIMIKENIVYYRKI